MRVFDETESAFTATASNLTPSAGETIDFTKWGNPERAAINEAAPMVNIYNYRRFGGI
jgi:hypothetical protein